MPAAFAIACGSGGSTAGDLDASGRDDEDASSQPVGDGAGTALDGASSDAAALARTDGGGEPSVDCMGTSALQPPTTAATRRRVHGSNGDFEDRCDAKGMLIKYTCELVGPCEPQGPCTQTATGKVLSQTIDCAGTCASGACLPRCPTAGEPLEYKSLAPDGTATLESTTTQRDYVCQLSSVVVDASYDCRTTPQVGLAVVVTDAGDAGLYCSSTSVRLVLGSTAVDPHCAYECQVPR
jgi:hypothetical protein